MYSKFPAITKSTPADHVSEILQQQHFDRNYRDGDKLSCSRILSDGEFQLTEHWSAKYLLN